MAAVHPQSSRPHPHSPTRLRSTSDPFVDPTTNARHRAPPPPPKPSTAPRMPAAAPKPPSKDINDITEAVRDTVTMRDRNDSPRTRVGRSQTAVSPLPNSNSRPTAQRSRSQDSGPAITEKPRSSGKGRGKKGSQHADVIDRLDYTGVGLFHHDGPFDACAPSRNKQRNKAPLYAWSGMPDPTQYGDSAYPSAHAYAAFSNDYPEPPKKKVDAIAEAWGIHEPEPFEDFSAGGGSARPEGDTPSSSIYNGKDSHHSNSTSRGGAPKRSEGGGQPQASRDQRPRVATRRSLVPPPKPIFVPDPIDADASGSPASSPDFPKRQKSIMQRIRKMRDSPNVPVGPEYEQPPSPNSPADQFPQSTNSNRPTHKHQSSFLGRFANAKPQSPGNDRSEPFVLIDPQSNKELPLPPVASATNSGDSAQFPQEAGNGGINRRTSIMKKMGRVVRGTR